MSADVGWGLLILVVGAGFCFISFHALFRTTSFIDRMNRMAFGPEPPVDKVRRSESAGYIAWVRVFAGGALLFLGAVSILAAVESFVRGGN